MFMGVFLLLRSVLYAFSLALVLDLVFHFHMSLVLVLESKADFWLVS